MNYLHAAFLNPSVAFDKVAWDKEGVELRNDINDLREIIHGVRLPTAKSTNEVNHAIEKAKQVFEKAKASASYGISDTIYYGVILPLKELIVGLTDDQKTDLDLYKKHTALCSGIQKVQTAHKSYIAAQKAANEAPTEPEFARKDARLHAIAKGNSLIAEYTNLIKLAIDQAEEIEVDKFNYLEDLNRELDKEFHINTAVNTLRPKLIIESDWLEYECRGIFNNDYLKFVTEFISNVREARLQLGESSVGDDDDIFYISDAYIRGLANIPELGEIDDGLVLIAYYDELTRLQAPERITETQNEVVEYFKKEIESLMRRPCSIWTGDFQDIQYKGISLLSVLKTLDVDQLNQLKESGKNLQTIQRQISTAQAEIRGAQEGIAESFDYSFKQVGEFLNVPTVKRANLKGIPKDDTALGRLKKAYTEALERHAFLTTQIEETTENQAQAKSDRKDLIDANQAELDKTKLEIKRLEQAVDEASSELETKQLELNEFKKAIAAEIKIMAVEKKGSSKIQKDLKEMKISGFKKDTDAEVTTRQEEINQLLASRHANQLEFLAQGEKSTDLKFAIADLREEDTLLNKEEAITLEALNIELEELQASKVAELTAEEHNDLAKHLKIEGRIGSTNSIASRLDGFVNAKARVELLTNDTLPPMQRQAEEISAQMESISPFLTLNDEQAFVLDAAIFGDDEKAEIAAQLESNLSIAKQVTMEVGRKIVAQDNEFLREKAEQDTGSSHRSNRIYANVESKLKNALDAREKGVKKVDLTLLVSEGMEKLAPVVSKKPVEVTLQVLEMDSEDEI